jgi:tetratricopeptide (TPR) repeat protein
MVPPELMLTNKKPGLMRRASRMHASSGGQFCAGAHGIPASKPAGSRFASTRTFFSALLGILILTGCGPPGPRALVKGERLIREGKYEEATEKLLRATQLLPKNAQAWNHLGLAYHGNNQPLPAIRAYRQALQLDNKLAAARFNLGCLYLDQNDLSSAVEQLTSYTYVQPNDPDGWVKLATAHLRGNRPDLAERNFRSALDLQAGNVEALNGLGLIQFQRRRYAEAYGTFDQALAQNPNYAPALLNAAIAAQQTPANRQTALQLYRRYLAQTPRPDDFDKITAAANQLEADLNPSRIAASSSASQAAGPKVANVPRAAVRVTNSTPATSGAVSPNRSNQVVALGPPLPPKTSPSAGSSNAFALTNLAQYGSVPTNGASVELTRIDNGFEIKSPQDLGPGRGLAPTIDQPLSTNGSASPLVDKSDKATKRGGLFSKFRSGNTKTPKGQTPVILPSPAPVTETVPIELAPAPVPRYPYIALSKPTAGDRVKAEKFRGEADAAQRAGQLPEAISGYKAAVASDPAFFDAYYNLALAAYKASKWNEAALACEHALAINPESKDARFRLSMALMKSDFSQDAVEQLEFLLQKSPNDANYHQWAAKIYAEQLKQPQLARQHYMRVLQLEPANDQAAAIRQWLDRHPG